MQRTHFFNTCAHSRRLIHEISSKTAVRVGSVVWVLPFRDGLEWSTDGGENSEENQIMIY